MKSNEELWREVRRVQAKVEKEIAEKEKMTNSWHTGIPAEDGLYVIQIHPYGSISNDPTYACYYIENGILKDCLDKSSIDADSFWLEYAMNWLKIEPYKEKEDAENSFYS